MKLPYDTEKKSQFALPTSDERTVLSILNSEIPTKISSIAVNNNPTVGQIITTSKEVIDLLQLAFKAGLEASQTNQQKENKNNYKNEVLSKFPKKEVESLLQSYVKLVKIMGKAPDGAVTKKTAGSLQIQLKNLLTSVQYAVDIHIGETDPSELGRGIHNLGLAMKPVSEALPELKKGLNISLAAIESISQVIYSDDKLKGRTLSLKNKEKLVKMVSEILSETEENFTLKEFNRDKVFDTILFSTQLKLVDLTPFSNALKEKIEKKEILEPNTNNTTSSYTESFNDSVPEDNLNIIFFTERFNQSVPEDNLNTISFTKKSNQSSSESEDKNFITENDDRKKKLTSISKIENWGDFVQKGKQNLIKDNNINLPN